MKCTGCGKDLSHVKQFPYGHGCGYVTYEDGSFRVAAEKPDAPPRILARGWNYARAWIRWVADGRPVRSGESVEALRSICRECRFFDGNICTHKKCGCNVAQGHWWGDKLRWATEHCPIKKW